MRHAPWIPLALCLALVLPGTAAAQQARRLKATRGDVQIGFQPVARSAADSYGFKAGLWSPVLVRFHDDEDEGNLVFPAGPGGRIEGELLVETTDSDGVKNIYPRKFILNPDDPPQVLSYVKVASTGPDVEVKVKIGTKTVSLGSTSYLAMDVGSHMYLSLGDNLLDLHEALMLMVNANAKNDPNATKETRPRYATYENDVKSLPDQWFGYQGVDLAILTTGNDKFLDRLVGDQQGTPQLAALADWVRRGGRLVISVAPGNREKVQRLLTSPAWSPALPPVMPAEVPAYNLTSLEGLRDWSAAGAKEPIRPRGKDGQAGLGQGVRLQALPTVSVLCTERDGNSQVPLIVRFPHGLGSITVMGFDAKASFLAEWSGKPEFWKAVVNKLAPVVATGGAQFPGGPGGPRGRQAYEYGSTDLTSRLYTELEKFDTPTISFGWVALFILIYILVVGPVDYLILKLLFKRLELTWLTFPAVVLTVSLLAYFTAYAIKGRDLKVNKLDLVDIDLRSHLKEDLTPASARAYGTSWFTILSPRIQNYTIGLEPRLAAWEGAEKPGSPLPVTLSWLGRPEPGGMGTSGRGRSPSLFSRTYSFAPAATGLRDVPIPVWTTKSFTAAWEGSFKKLPLDVKLTYDPGRTGSIPRGTITNHLGFDLVDVWLIYQNNAYRLSDLPKGVAVRVGGGEGGGEEQLTKWSNINTLQPGNYYYGGGKGPSDFEPTMTLRCLMFQEKVVGSGNSGLMWRNHAQRNLDQSWRLDSLQQVQQMVVLNDDGRVRDAIIVGRIARASGPLEQLHAEGHPALATHLWLGAIPGQAEPEPGQPAEGSAPAGSRPTLQGNLVQDTFVRVLVPVTKAKE
jgi:hypothetical protein